MDFSFWSRQAMPQPGLPNNGETGQIGPETGFKGNLQPAILYAIMINLIL